MPSVMMLRSHTPTGLRCFICRPDEAVMPISGTAGIACGGAATGGPAGGSKASAEGPNSLVGGMLPRGSGPGSAPGWSCCAVCCIAGPGCDHGCSGLVSDSMLNSPRYVGRFVGFPVSPGAIPCGRNLKYGAEI